MTRYRQVFLNLWSDEKFNQLSKPEPNARDLWIYLLIGRCTTSMPGVIPIGFLSLMEQLGWYADQPNMFDEGFQEGFQEGFEKRLLQCKEVFKELLDKGMIQADLKHKIIYLPKAKFYTPPDNPNVIKGWRYVWAELPECELKTIIKQDFESFLKGFKKGFLEVFQELSMKPWEVGFLNGIRNQEQEQEQDIASSSPPQNSKNGAVKKERVLELVDEEYLKSLRVDPTYKNIDVDFAYGKFLNWLNLKENKGKKATKKRFLFWLGREKPTNNQQRGRYDTRKKAEDLEARKAKYAGVCKD